MMVRLYKCIFWLKIVTYWKNIILFEIKSALILIKNLIANLSTIKNSWKPKSYNGEATDFHDKEMPKGGSNHTCLSVITIDSALKKYENYYLQEFLKEFNYIGKEVTKSRLEVTENLKNIFWWFWWIQWRIN